MSPIFTGFKCVWGIPIEVKPVSNAPAGRRRLKFRAKSAVRCYVSTPNGIRCCILEDCGNHWRWNNNMEQGRNLRQNGVLK